jgi:hypothetical protein
MHVAGAVQDQKPRRRIADSLKGMHGPIRYGNEIALLSERFLAVDHESNLSVEDIEPFGFSGMVVGGCARTDGNQAFDQAVFSIYLIGKRMEVHEDIQDVKCSCAIGHGVFPVA